MTLAVLAGPSRAPVRGGAFRWGASFAIALALHLAGAVALFLWRTPIMPASPPPAAIMIDLAPLPAAPVPAAPPVPTPPPPVAPPQEVRPEPAPVPVPVPVPPPLPPRRPVEHPRVHHPVTPPKPTPPPAESAPTAVAPVPVAPAPAPALRASPSVPANAVPSFEGLLAAHLDRYKRYPRAAQTRGQEGVAWLRFTMDRQGHVLAYRIERSSGHDVLDQEVLALIQRAQPLPPIPASIPSSTLEVVVPVKFSLR